MSDFKDKPVYSFIRFRAEKKRRYIVSKYSFVETGRDEESNSIMYRVRYAGVVYRGPPARTQRNREVWEDIKRTHDEESLKRFNENPLEFDTVVVQDVEHPIVGGRLRSVIENNIRYKMYTMGVEKKPPKSSEKTAKIAGWQLLCNPCGQPYLAPVWCFAS
jgi:hypothetical protein